MALLAQFQNILIAGIQNKLILINFDTGDSSTLLLPEIVIQSKKENKESQDISLKDSVKVITCMCFSRCGELFGLTTNTKQLVIYKNFKIIKNFLLKRVASKIRFTPNNNLIVADKTGDVFLYKLSNNDLEPQLLLGHLSMLLDVLVSSCNKYVITCDRDEKIRVSRYPNAYNIVTYCLGHREFVTNIELFNNILISASGDGTIKLWNYLNGEQIDSIDTNKYLPDTNLKNEFCKHMDKDNVEISALPITNMKLVIVESRCFVVTSLLSYNLLVFEIENNKLNFVQNISLNSQLITFSSNGILIILTDQGFSSFQLEKSLFVIKHFPYLEQLYKDNKNLFEIPYNNNNIMVLYKRKYDNVQEYLERKKQRLEIG